MRRGFALLELPFILALLALIGIVLGGFLWVQAGRMTVGALVSLCLAFPLTALIVVWVLMSRRTLRGSDRSLATKV